MNIDLIQTTHRALKTDNFDAFSEPTLKSQALWLEYKYVVCNLCMVRQPLNIL